MNIKKSIKKFVPQKIFYFVRDAVYPEKIDVLEKRIHSLFFKQYESLAAPRISQKDLFKNLEYKVYSKHGGDGILAHIFSKIGRTNRTFVEMGVEDGTECNTANLSLNFGWKGLLIDANEAWIQKARDFYKKKLGASSENVRMTVGFVTAESINTIITDSGFGGPIDLLSIDIDSNDYFVWDAIKSVDPRVVVMEYNAAFGLRSLTIKYDPKFHYQEAFKQNPLYFGASLTALSRLAKKKGYILVACDTHGHDAFFVKKDAAEGKFTELTPEEAFYPNPYNIGAIGSIETQFDSIKHLEFVEVK